MLSWLLPAKSSVQRTNDYFSQVAVDQAIEQTVNRDSKTSGGIIGLSTNAPATHHWILTNDSVTHKEQARTRIARDEHFSSISFGVQAAPDVQVDLLTAYSMGQSL